MVSPVKIDLNDVTGFSLQLDMTIEGQEGSAALTSGNVEDTAIDENTAGDIAKNVTSKAIKKSFDKTFKELKPKND